VKTTVTTREYDDEGRCVKETTVEYDNPATGVQQIPVAPRVGQCTCWQPWGSTTGHWCPAHGPNRPYVSGGMVTTGTTPNLVLYNGAA
jgi:hypothetical protein